MLKWRKYGGFTLAELLIVVAIISVLVSVAIPNYMCYVERSREAVDVSNLRSAYSPAAAYEPGVYYYIGGDLTPYSSASTLPPMGKGTATDGRFTNKSSNVYYNNTQNVQNCPIIVIVGSQKTTSLFLTDEIEELIEAVKVGTVPEGFDITFDIPEALSYDFDVMFYNPVTDEYYSLEDDMLFDREGNVK